MGLLDTIRAAVAGPDGTAMSTDPADVNEDINRPCGASKEAEMADKDTAPGAATTGISEADHKAAVTKAETDGKAAGRKEATERVTTILAADGIKGDGTRMSAALDLATKSPDMAAEDVVGYVTANVTAGKPSAAASYEQQRLASAGLTEPGGANATSAKADLNPSSIYAARREAAQKGA
jgi:hypothetical protein